MIKKNKFNIWPYIIGPLIGFMVIKYIPHTDFYKSLGQKSYIKSQIEVSAVLNKDSIDFVVSNSSGAKVKDLKVECEFYAESKTYLGSEKYIIYKSFIEKKETEVDKFEVEFPSQSNNLTCLVKDFVFSLEGQV